MYQTGGDAPRTRAELCELARQRDLPGRSRMGRDELAAARRVQRGVVNDYVTWIVLGLAGLGAYSRPLSAYLCAAAAGY